MAIPAALTAALNRGWTRTWPENAVLFDGSSMPRPTGSAMAAVQGGGTSGVALVSTTTGVVQHVIERYSAVSQALGAYNGSYAVWEESNSAGTFDDYVVKEWNARTGAITTVGGAHKDASGAPIVGSDELPVISGDHAAWLEAVKSDGLSDLVVLDLRTGYRQVFREAHASWLNLTPTMLLWSESLRPGAKTIIRAANLASGKIVPTPAALAKARGASDFVTDGTDWAWVQGTRPTLYVADSAQSEPIEIGRVPYRAASPVVSISDGIVTVPVSIGGMMVANVATRAWTYQSTASYPVLVGRDFLVPELSTSKSSTAGTSVAEMTAPELTSLTC